MSTETPDFTDILSAALDESGITGEENFDFDFTVPAGQITPNTYGSLPVPSIESVATPIQQRSLVHHTTPVLVNGPIGNRNQSLIHPPTPIAVNGQRVSNGNQSLVQPTAPIIVNGQPVSNGNQLDLFSQRLKQLAAGTNSSNAVTVPRIINTSSTLTPGPSPGSSFHRSSSSPAVIKLPANGGDIVSQLPQILRQQSAQTGDPNKTKIITVKRMGPDGSVTQSRSFQIGGKTPAPTNGGHKIIVRSANGDQVIQSGSGSQSVKGMQTAAPTVTHSSNLQPLSQTQSSSVFSHNMNTSVMDSNSGRQNVIHMPRPMSEVNFNENRTFGQTGSVSSRIVSSQSNISQPGTIHVIRRPYMSSPVTNQGLHHSQSMPSHLSNISNIPSVVIDRENRNTPSPVHIISQPGLSGGKVMPGLQNVTASNGYNPLNTISSLAAMQRSVNSLPMNNLTNKDVSRMWSNQDIKLKSITPHHHVLNSNVVHQREPTLIEEEEEGEEVEGLGQAETYSEYMPAKLKLGIKHPDPVVETSSMSSIEPPDIFYKLSIPEHTIDYGDLSALQLESITYASQRHQLILPSGERAGFLIGDGAGVGKGRTLAGIIFENYLLGRKRALWLSVSNDLRHDAERDLRDIGAGKIDVHALNKFKYAKISSKENGNVKKGVIFATYSSLIGESHSGGKYKTRFKQLLKWCGKEFDGVIVFDECHKAKNLCPVGSSKPTKTGQTVLELQKRLPKARVVYASATGASEPKNMAYMTRLGLWGPGTPFPEFNDFIQAVERRGVGAMELVAMDMKLRGMYIARQLSFKGVSFKIQEIPIDKEYIKVYNDAVALWVDAREMFQSAAELIDAEHRMRKSMWGQFWSAHQRFFKYLCISAKVYKCVQLAREAIRDGKCVVIGLQSTGEARTLEQLEEMGGELNDFVSTANYGEGIVYLMSPGRPTDIGLQLGKACYPCSRGVFQTLVEKHFPAPDRRKFFDIFGLGGGSSSSYNEDSNPPTPGSNKRKKDQMLSGSTKKQKTGSGSDSSNSESEESDFDFGLSDTSLSDESSDNDNFNPFGAGSDSDDDPWLKKTANSKTGSKVKEKKKKKEKEKEKKKKKKSKEDDLDAEFDKALAKSGLLKKEPPQTNGTGGTTNTSGDAVEKAFNMKRELLERIELLGERLPPNMLDQLIDDLGGPDNVAEMTGRKGRVVCTDDGISYESRSESDVPLEILNLTEKQRFMDGEKNIAIISEAASSGISLQADRRAVNQRRRVHITLELPWSADRAIQQFGRTHRSNQVSAPEYLFLISELAGEQRFASTVSKRLESLGALTHGDRRATESRDLSRFNFDNKFGRAALESVMKSVCGYDSPFVPPPQYEKGDFFADCKRSLVGVGMVIQENPSSVPILDKDYNSISKFLNRMLGMEVVLQNTLFKYFSNSLASIILEAKRSGRWDMGILDLGSGGESVKKLETKIFVGNTATNTAKTELIQVSVERGMSFTGAYDIWKKYTGVEDGFYLSLQDRTIRRFAIVAAFQGGYSKRKEKLYTVYRPNTGLQPRQETLAEIKKKYKKVLPEEAQRYWEEQYSDSATVCSHAYWRGSCKKISLGLPCEVGLRSRTYYVLSGSVLSVWNKVERVLVAMPGGNQTKMQVIRLRTDDNQRIVGSLIPSNCVEALCSVLMEDCSKTYTEKHTENERPAPKEESQAINTLSMPVLM